MESCILVPVKTAETAHQLYAPTNSGSFGFKLIGHLMLQGGISRLTPTELRETLESVWKPRLPWKLTAMGKSCYTLSFSCLEDYLHVDTKRCWYVEYGFIKIESWASDFKHVDTMVYWTPPPPSWIKINTDGAARGRPGELRSACGGVFRDSTGSVLGCFSKKSESRCALEAEIDGAITSLEFAWAQGWNKIWLESDCSELVTMLLARSSSDHMVPTEMTEPWLGVLNYINEIEFDVSHIYREGNQVADALANPDVESGMWACATRAIKKFVSEDALGLPHRRVRV